MVTLDPRIHPFRPELAAAHLHGQVEAARFIEGRRYEVIEPLADLRRSPSHDSSLDTQALLGETFTAYEITEEGWAWGQLECDGYVGWLPAYALSESSVVHTHKVIVPRTFVFPGPDIKMPPMTALPMGARLAITQQDERFAATQSGWHIPGMHLAPIRSEQPDFVGIAEQFLNVPYLWGGKSALGIDCSGLVQIALQATGHACPRDSDMQELALGMPSSQSHLQRGDLVFWKGHVAITYDEGNLIHANAHHMIVSIEKIAVVLARIKAAGSELISIKRFT
jgi:cell wall-associated NlpC family hydrolase